MENYKIEFTGEETILLMAAINKAVRGYQPDPTVKFDLQTFMPIVAKIAQARTGKSLEDVTRDLLK